MKKSLIILLILLLGFGMIGCQKKTQVTVEEAEEKVTEETAAEDVKKTEPAKGEEEKQAKVLVISPNDELIIHWNNIGGIFQFPDENDNPTGFQPEIVNAVMKEMGQKYKWVREDQFDKFYQDLKTGEIHLQPATIFTPEREKVYKFSETQMGLQSHMWVHKDTEGVGGNTVEEVWKSCEGKKVATPAKSDSYEQGRQYKAIEWIFIKDVHEGFALLKDKKADVLPYVDIIVADEIKKNNYPFKAVGVPITQFVFGGAFCPNIDDGLIDRYNKGMKAIKDNGTFARIYRKWFGMEYKE